MDYSDFGSLLVLAIGCNLIYIVNEDKKRNNLSFFLFLRQINNAKETIKKLIASDSHATVILSKLKEIKKKSVDEIEKIYGKDSEYILNNINIEYPSSMREKFEKVIFPFSGTSKLQSITLITFSYSFFVALFAPYKWVSFNELLFQMNIVILLFAVILLIYGAFAKNNPKRLFDIIGLLIIFVSSVMVLFFKDDLSKSIINRCDNILDCNYVITILICFTGFILYTALHIVGLAISLYYRYSSYKLNSKFSKLKKIIETHKDEFDKILLADVKKISIEK